MIPPFLKFSNSSILKPILVVGSINMDLVCRMPRFPSPGETILGSDFFTASGGKGANQAVAAARLGATVHLVGRLGADGLGDSLLAGLRENVVHAKHIAQIKGVPSGCALILLDDKGQNSIVVVPGANHHLAPADIDAAEDLIRQAAIVLMQLEIPIPAAERTAALCRKHGVSTILDPAPAPPQGLTPLLSSVNILTPNQSEAETLLGRRVSNPEEAGQALIERGAQCVVLKLGEDGAMIIKRNEKAVHVPAFKVRAVDTTAAGDAFTGALAVAISEGRQLPDAVRFACAAGALTCTRLGAQPSLPGRTEVDFLLE